MSALILMAGILVGIASTAILTTGIGEWGILFILAAICMVAGVVILERHNHNDY